MQEAIRTNLNNPRQLEELFRSDRANFIRSFNLLYPEIKDNSIAQVWHARLNFEKETISRGSFRELIFIVIACVVAGLIAKIPDWAQLDPELYYSRNIGFIFLPLMMAYFSWRQNVSLKKVAGIAAVLFVSVVYMNFLPVNSKSDTILLACLHMPLFVWAVTGIAFGGYRLKDLSARLEYLKFNGELAVMMAVLLIAGGLLTGIAFGLFELIGINIEWFFSKYILVFGLPAVPLLATYLVQTNPHLVNKVSPVIARIFTPLVVVTLVVYLIAIINSGKDLYNDREFLLLFNLLLIGVMALILFALTGVQQDSSSRVNTFLLILLAFLAVIVNGWALSAILFRISEWGFTPNRIAVLGSNLLMLTNLLVVVYRLVQLFAGKNDRISAEQSIAAYLPVYLVWTFLIVFLLPVVYGFL